MIFRSSTGRSRAPRNSHRADKKAGTGGPILVAQELPVRQPGVVPDQGVDEVEAEARGAVTDGAGATVSAPPTAVGDPAELFDGHVSVERTKGRHSDRVGGC